MGENSSRGHEISAEIRDWIVAIAAVCIFWWFGYEYNAAQNKLATATAQLAEKTVDDQARKAQFDAIQSQLAAITSAATIQDEITNKRFLAMQSEVDLTLKDYAVKQAAFETTERGSPSIRVIPELTQSTSYKGVREIMLDTEITNVGRVPANVRQIKVNVSTGQAGPAAFDKINRTQQLYDLDQLIRGYNSGQPRSATTQDDDLFDRAPTVQEQYDRLHSECPHGYIFALAQNSADVKWTTHPEKSWTCNVDMRLSPNASASQIFPYVITESLYHNTNWVRFDMVVSLDSDSTQRFQFFVPFTRQSESRIVGYSATRNSTGEREAASPLLFRPRSPLAPIRDGR